ncbi:hypothetical protein DRO26_01625 [Candidatus Bathyarchaeota archaeon]|nr:MAG: hypothetical protein DRO26_01625 [Candidatus Bathyarchaeota archaeon]
MDAVIKVGGSLAEKPKNLRNFCLQLARFSRFYRILVIPGGGVFADVVRILDRTYRISAKTTHTMAVLGMDQYGFFLADLIPNSRIVYSLKEAKKAASLKVLPVLIPSRLVLKTKLLKPSWEVTSDSIAAYVAAKIKAKKLLLVTDVDGIFTENPKTNPSSNFLKEISTTELLKWNTRTCVDKFAPKLIQKFRTDSYVVNGYYPVRIRKILEEKPTIYTKINP